LRQIPGACGLDRGVHLRGWRRRFRLRRRLGRGKLLVTFGIATLQKPTNRPLGHIFAPTESNVNRDNLRRYLRCHKLWCSAEGVCSASITHLLFTQPIISNLDMPVQCEQDVVQLQIPIYDLVLMQVLERQQDLRSVESKLVESTAGAY